MEERRAGLLDEKLQLLRSITNSNAGSKRSIIEDASRYIQELKDKVERLNQEITSCRSSSSTTNCTQENSSLPEVTVELTEKGVMVNVYADGNRPTLLVAVLEAFNEMNLDVIEARVSCTDSFRFEAVGGRNEESIDAQAVRQAILQSIGNSMAENGDGRLIDQAQSDT